MKKQTLEAFYILPNQIYRTKGLSFAILGGELKCWKDAFTGEELIEIDHKLITYPAFFTCSYCNEDTPRLDFLGRSPIGCSHCHRADSLKPEGAAVHLVYIYSWPTLIY